MLPYPNGALAQDNRTVRAAVRNTVMSADRRDLHGSRRFNVRVCVLVIQPHTIRQLPVSVRLQRRLLVHAARQAPYMLTDGYAAAEVRIR